MHLREHSELDPWPIQTVSFKIVKSVDYRELTHKVEWYNQNEAESKWPIKLFEPMAVKKYQCYVAILNDTALTSNDKGGPL